MKRILFLDWLSGGEVELVKLPPIDSKAYLERVAELKEQMGVRHILHESHKVHRLDGKVYARGKPRLRLRKVV